MIFNLRRSTHVSALGTPNVKYPKVARQPAHESCVMTHRMSDEESCFFVALHASACRHMQVSAPRYASHSSASFKNILDV